MHAKTRKPAFICLQHSGFLRALEYFGQLWNWQFNFPGSGKLWNGGAFQNGYEKFLDFVWENSKLS